MNEAEQKLRAVMDTRASEAIALCQKLVQIPSEDPPGDTREIARFIDGFFKSYGIDSEIVAPHAEKPNVVATVQGAHPGKHVVYNGHIDTFPVGDASRWTHDPFGGAIEDGKLYGRGATDMKGGVAASMMAVVMLNELRDRLPGKISITCVSDEEVFGPWGSRYLLKEHPELLGDALINGEPSSLEHLRIGEKGKHRFRIRTWGQGGHGAYARLKRNAIGEMIKILAQLDRFDEENGSMVPEDLHKVMERSRTVYDKILGTGATDVALSTTVNIGTIAGGIMVNTIAENCVAELDFRVPAGVKADALRDWVAKKVGAFDNASFEVMSSAETFLTMPDHPLVRTTHGVAEEICGFPVYPNYGLGGNEAYLWRERGTPAVVYGPSHHNMASPDEYALVDELPLVAKVHALAAWRFLNA